MSHRENERNSKKDRQIQRKKNKQRKREAVYDERETEIDERETEKHRRKEQRNLVKRDSWKEKVSFCEDGSLKYRCQIGCFKMNLMLI